jgi:hypothetical protein
MPSYYKGIIPWRRKVGKLCNFNIQCNAENKIQFRWESLVYFLVMCGNFPSVGLCNQTGCMHHVQESMSLSSHKAVAAPKLFIGFIISNMTLV